MLRHPGQRAAGPPRGGRRQAVADLDDVGQPAVKVDLALHVGLAQVVQAWCQQQRQCRGLAHGQRDLRLVEMAKGIFGAIPQAQADRQVGIVTQVGDPVVELLFQGLLEKHALYLPMVAARARPILRTRHLLPPSLDPSPSRALA
ncbi:hypothetical protein D9M68_715190 [compost metagenome]